MWSRVLDVFPGEWIGTEHEKECEKELELGDYAKVIVNSQFREFDKNSKEPLQRRIGQIGEVVDIDPYDEWSYQLKFPDGDTNWFKRYILQKMD